MKKTTQFIFLLFVSFSTFAQNKYEFTVKGELPDSGNDGTYVYLSSQKLASIVHQDATPEVKTDSALIQDGKFMLRGTATKKGELFRVP